MVWPFSRPDPTPIIRGQRLILRAAKPSDYAAWYALRKRSQAFLKPFEPRWTEADLAQGFFNQRIRRSREEALAGSDFSFLIFRIAASGDVLLGGLTLSNIRRRAAQFVTLGYWMGEPFAGQGIMTEAVSMILPFVFDSLLLHRIQAAFLPINQASRRVLEKNGFREEGFAENYLQIDGRWADHVLFGLTKERYDALRRR
jgi:[ribosomal protein S5]-alanine N-acetyltransferase